MKVRIRLIAFAMAIAALPACSGQKMAPVKGRVMFDGKPVKEAAVTFSPSGTDTQLETGKPGTAFTDENGDFEVSTFSKYDGAIVGTHNVLVTVDDTNPAKCKRIKTQTLEVKPGSNNFTIEMDGK